jgi:hypothetical protein
MSADRKGIDALVCEYLANGGRIRRIPDPLPVGPAEVLEYLGSRDVTIEIVPRKDANSPVKYRHKGQLLSWRALVQLANGHRRRQRLAPFEPN